MRKDPIFLTAARLAIELTTGLTHRERELEGSLARCEGRAGVLGAMRIVSRESGHVDGDITGL
jgi:hypothetical protein